MASLSVRAVAERARTSDRTIRRWIAEGKLPASRTPDGWTVDESDLSALLDGRPSPDNGHSADVRPSDGHVDGRPRGRPSDEAPHLAALVRELQRQNLELAGLVGSLQQRLLFAEDRIHALEAPREPDPADVAPDAPGGATDAVLTEAAQRPAERRRPWWRFW